MAMGFRTQGAEVASVESSLWFQSSKASFGTRAEEMAAKVIVRQMYIPFLWTGFLSGT